MERVAYSVEAASKATDTGKTTLYDAINEGELQAKKLGRRTLILAKDLDQWLENLPEFKSAKNSEAEFDEATRKSNLNNA